MPQQKNLSRPSRLYPWSHFDPISYGQSLCRWPEWPGAAEKSRISAGPCRHAKRNMREACPSDGRRRDAPVGRLTKTAARHKRGVPPERHLSGDASPRRLYEGHGVTKFAKKRVSKFDERSHYVIENKGSGKRTKPNEANFAGGKTLPACSADLFRRSAVGSTLPSKSRRPSEQVCATLLYPAGGSSSDCG